MQISYLIFFGKKTYANKTQKQRLSRRRTRHYASRPESESEPVATLLTC